MEKRGRPALPRAIRRLVRERAGNRCEYCLHPASYASGPFVCEHVKPRAYGAGDALTELAWACSGCNGHKYDKTHARDPVTGRMVSLFNPRRQLWTQHFSWSEDFLQVGGRTPTGRATVATLHLNRPELINLRRALLRIDAHPPPGHRPS